MSCQTRKLIGFIHLKMTGKDRSALILRRYLNKVMTRVTSTSRCIRMSTYSRERTAFTISWMTYLCTVTTYLMLINSKAKSNTNSSLVSSSLGSSNASKIWTALASFPNFRKLVPPTTPSSTLSTSSLLLSASYPWLLASFRAAYASAKSKTKRRSLPPLSYCSSCKRPWWQWLACTSRNKFSARTKAPTTLNVLCLLTQKLMDALMISRWLMCSLHNRTLLSQKRFWTTKYCQC